MRLSHKRAPAVDITSALQAAQQRGEAPADVRTAPMCTPPAKRLCQPRIMLTQLAPPPKHPVRLQQCPPALFCDSATLCVAATDGTQSAQLSPAGSSTLYVQLPASLPRPSSGPQAAASGADATHTAPPVRSETLPWQDSVAAAEAAAALAAVDMLMAAPEDAVLLHSTSSWSCEELAACVAATTPPLIP